MKTIPLQVKALQHVVETGLSEIKTPNTFISHLKFWFKIALVHSKIYRKLVYKRPNKDDKKILSDVSVKDEATTRQELA